MLIGQLEHGNWNTERDNRNMEHDKHASQNNKLK